MMGSIKETNESGCRNMPGTGIQMIVEFISSINREIKLLHTYTVLRKLRTLKASVLYFCLCGSSVLLFGQFWEFKENFLLKCNIQNWYLPFYDFDLFFKAILFSGFAWKDYAHTIVNAGWNLVIFMRSCLVTVEFDRQTTEPCF